jgi:hypothetical protein
MSTLPSKRFRVTIVEWLTHDTVIEAADETAARAEALRLWSENPERFSFDDSGLDGVQLDELLNMGDPS